MHKNSVIKVLIFLLFMIPMFGPHIQSSWAANAPVISKSGTATYYAASIHHRVARGLANKRARKMMRKYKLHPAKRLKTGKSSMSAYTGDSYFYDIFNNASSEIGLPLKKNDKRRIKILSYVLKERCQNGGDSTVTAYFLADSSGSIISAYMILDGYIPGVVALTDRYALVPKGLLNNQLVFRGVRSIEIFRSAGMDDFATSATISRSRDIRHFCRLLERSKKQKGEFWPATIGHKQYTIRLEYADGEWVTIRLAPRGKHFEMGLDNYRQLYYAPKALKRALDGLLR